jgi:hypothetical protein
LIVAVCVLEQLLGEAREVGGGTVKVSADEPRCRW